MSRPIRWVCENGHRNLGSPHCSRDDCDAVLSRRDERGLTVVQTLEDWLPRFLPFDRSIGRPWAHLAVFAVLLLAITLSIIPGLGGMFFLVADGTAEEGCTSSVCPTIETASAVRVTSSGLLEGPGNVGLDERVYLSITRNDSERAALILRGPDGRELGTTTLAERGDVWVTRLDEAPPPGLTGSIGSPTGRSTLTFERAGDVGAVDVGRESTDVVEVRGPLSQLPVVVVWVLVVLLVLVVLRRGSEANLKWSCRLLTAVVLGVVVAGWVRAPIASHLGKAYGDADYSFVVGMVIVVAIGLTAVVLPTLGLTVVGGWVSRGVDRVLVRRTRPRLIGLRLLGAVTTVVPVVLVFQMADQVLGSLFLGWQL